MEENLQEWLMACKAGNEEKWNLLFSKYYPIARKLVKNKLRTVDSQTVDLIAQDVMLALYGKIQDINDARHLGFFVRAVVHNKCVDFIRRNKLVALPVTEDMPFVEEEEFLTQRMREAIFTALANLNEPIANILRLRFFESMSYREIAARTGIVETQVGMKLSRALHGMKEELAKLGITSMSTDEM